MLGGTGDSRESFATETPIFIARQVDSHDSLEFPIRANHATKKGSAGAILGNLRKFLRAFKGNIWEFKRTPWPLKGM